MATISTQQKIVPCLWFSDQAEEAAGFYVSVFSVAAEGTDCGIGRISRYTSEGFEIHQRPAGSVLTVEFWLDGQQFLALNGGPVFKFSEAVSFVILCDTQEEIDYYWQKLSEGGDEAAQQCGWLKDKYGLSWQVSPRMMGELFLDPDSASATRAMRAMLQMKKLDIAALEQAVRGEG